MDNIKIDKIPPKSNEKYMPFLQCISSFEGNSCKNLKDTATADLLFLVVFVRRSSYIWRYHFSKIFRTSFSIIWKANFQHQFSIFNKLTHPVPCHPLNCQNLLSVTKVFCWCSLTTSLQPLLRHLQLLQNTKVTFNR